MKKFAIIGMARSGTSCLSSCFSENIVQEPLMSNSGDAGKIKDITEKYEINPRWKTFDVQNVFNFLDEIYSRFDGIKHIYTSCIPNVSYDFVNYFKKNDIKIIWLSRRSIFWSAISNQFKNNNQLINQKINPDKIIENMKWFHLMEFRIFNYMLDNEINTSSNLIKYYYEDLYSNKANRINNLKNIIKFINAQNSELNQEHINKKFLEDKAVETMEKYEGNENYKIIKELELKYQHLFL
tara:strand:+ start:23970 stop:24686 length:717 start_codon:yes stop_codon:yes gene_type:complete